jgi:hypothetical protein
MNVGRYLRGEDLHVGTSRITKPKELKMNERIKELKQQARDFYLLQEDLDCSTKELHELVDTKFAELLIRECADICVGQRQYQPKEVYAQAVLSHFGVE